MTTTMTPTTRIMPMTMNNQYDPQELRNAVVRVFGTEGDSPEVIDDLVADISEDPEEVFWVLHVAKELDDNPDGPVDPWDLTYPKFLDYINGLGPRDPGDSSITETPNDQQALSEAMLTIFGTTAEYSACVGELNLAKDPAVAARIILMAKDLTDAENGLGSNDTPALTIDSFLDQYCKVDMSPLEFAAMYNHNEKWACELLLDGRLRADRPRGRISRVSILNYFAEYGPPTPEELDTALRKELLLDRAACKRILAEINVELIRIVNEKRIAESRRIAKPTDPTTEPDANAKE